MALIAVLADLLGSPLAESDLVEAAVSAERLTGVAGGAMDQNVIVRAKEGYALRIDFAPPSFRNVHIPDHISFVVAYSGQVAAKGASARDHYNSRVVGCRIAAAMLADSLDLGSPPPHLLCDVAGRDGIADAIEDLPEHASAEQAVPPASVPDIVAGSNIAPDVTVPVRQCAAHVLAEAGRVDGAEEALVEGDIELLGQHFNASHQSLRAFGASTPQLDAIVRRMCSAGAEGSRLTGAGFGGYAIAVCQPVRVQDVVNAATSATGGPAFMVAPNRGMS